MNRNSVFRRYGEMCTVLIFQSETNSPCAYLPPLYTLFSCMHTLWKASDLVMMYFFQYPSNLDIIKYTTLTVRFIFLPLSPEKIVADSVTKYCDYGLEIVKKNRYHFRVLKDLVTAVIHVQEIGYLIMHPRCRIQKPIMRV